MNLYFDIYRNDVLCQYLNKFPFISFDLFAYLKEEYFCVLINYIKLDSYFCDKFENQLVYTSIIF